MKTEKQEHIEYIIRQKSMIESQIDTLNVLIERANESYEHYKQQYNNELKEREQLIEELREKKEALNNLYQQLNETI